MSRGFFIPNSNNSAYVNTKKNIDGSYQYSQRVNEVGLGHQVALQSVSKQYNATIDKAYSNYLSANRGIRGSNMGQGYKEAYLQETQNQLESQIIDTNLNAANARTQLSNEAFKAIGDIRAQFETEVANMDRTENSLRGYYDYLKTLTNATNVEQGYLTPEQQQLPLEQLYESVLGAEPLSYIDEQGNKGLRYRDWLNNSLKDTTADRAWSEWLFNYGGFEQFKRSKKSNKS